jgi:hypothetical protein
LIPNTLLIKAIQKGSVHQIPRRVKPDSSAK